MQWTAVSMGEATRTPLIVRECVTWDGVMSSRIPPSRVLDRGIRALTGQVSAARPPSW